MNRGVLTIYLYVAVGGGLLWLCLRIDAWQHAKDMRKIMALRPESLSDADLTRWDCRLAQAKQWDRPDQREIWWRHDEIVRERRRRYDAAVSAPNTDPSSGGME